MDHTHALTKLYAANQLEPFIRHIRFPRFKNLENGLRITFDHPITALVGPNGTNKSSILRALEGCPELQNIGNHWFSTNLDPIQSEERHRYIHGYFAPSGLLVESIKMRIMKQNNPDYFETSKPRKSDQMREMLAPNETSPGDMICRTKTRWKSVAKNVVYLDFRQEIAAYDIQFYFDWRKVSKDLSSKKKLVRQRSAHVSRALDELESNHDLYGKDRILLPAVELTTKEVAWIGRILGREYVSIRLVKHDFFEVEGYTARLKTRHLQYSEAFAGSGEFAAIMLVHSLWNAPSKSLILMDEPEVSLHPGGQKALMDFVTEICKIHKHQVVLATHSATIISALPPHAIKVLTHNEMTGRISLAAQSTDPEEAFRRIGAASQFRQIFVEDDLARAIVQRAARSISDAFIQTIDVQALPGGAAAIKTAFIPTMTSLGSDASVILDGDQRLHPPLKASSMLSDIALPAELERLGIHERFVHRDGGNADNAPQVRRNQRSILDWACTNLGYLPNSQPENLLRAFEGLPPLSKEAAKEYWVSRSSQEHRLSSFEPLTAAHILATQTSALASVSDDNAELVEVANLIKRILHTASAG